MLYRERLCLTCINLPLKSAEKSSCIISTFTPSKLNFLDEVGGKNASHLWSADTETDSDTGSDGESDQKREFVKENLTERIADDVIISNIINSTSKLGIAIRIPVCTPREGSDGVKISSSASRERMLRKLCDASFSDTQSATSSVSSRASVISRKSPVANGQCFHCNVDFGNYHRRHFCSHCYRVTCGTCSTTQVASINNTIHRTRVCSSCVPLPVEAEFTRGKLHLLDGGSGDSQGRRCITSRLWSADTETDSDDSRDKSTLFVNDSLAEDLTNVIQSEEREDSAVYTTTHTDLPFLENAVVKSETTVLESNTSTIMELKATLKPTELLSPRQKLHTTEFTAVTIMPGILQQRRAHPVTMLIVASLLMLTLSTVLPQLPPGALSASTAGLLELHEDSQYHINLSHPSTASTDQTSAPEGRIVISEFLTQPHEPESSSSIAVSDDTVVPVQPKETTTTPTPQSLAPSTAALQSTSPSPNMTAVQMVSAQYIMKFRGMLEGIRTLLSRLVDTMNQVLWRFRRPQRI